MRIIKNAMEWLASFAIKSEKFANGLGKNIVWRWRSFFDAFGQWIASRSKSEFWGTGKQSLLNYRNLFDAFGDLGEATVVGQWIAVIAKSKF